MEGRVMMEQQLQNIADVWPSIKNIFSVPHSEDEYENLVSLLDSLVDEIGENENHPLASLLEAIGNLVETYEKNTFPEMYGTPLETLRYLMDEHNVTQSDLPEIGSQGVVLEVLQGKRNLDIRQIKALSTRFNVSPLVFIQEQ
jgi:HTH-type transcriptional regulator/antitoxin HigA